MGILKKIKFEVELEYEGEEPDEDEISMILVEQVAGILIASVDKIDL